LQSKVLGIENPNPDTQGYEASKINKAAQKAALPEILSLKKAISSFPE
jgi:hypothetical protein